MVEETSQDLGPDPFVNSIAQNYVIRPISEKSRERINEVRTAGAQSRAEKKLAAAANKARRKSADKDNADQDDDKPFDRADLAHLIAAYEDVLTSEAEREAFIIIASDYLRGEEGSLKHWRDIRRALQAKRRAQSEIAANAQPKPKYCWGSSAFPPGW